MSGSEDNRIRLDQTPIDFSATDSVDQLHSQYPSPNTQARFDFMRSYLIGLLSNQSSPEDCEPIEKRIGTLWFNKTIQMLLLYSANNSFESLSKFISAESASVDEDGDPVTEIVTLQSILDDISGSLDFTGPRVVWSGIFSNDEDDVIPIPEEFQGYAELSGMKAFVFIEGLLIDPRKTPINENNFSDIRLIGLNVKPGQTFTVKLEKVTGLKQETVVA